MAAERSPESKRLHARASLKQGTDQVNPSCQFTGAGFPAHSRIRCVPRRIPCSQAAYAFSHVHASPTRRCARRCRAAALCHCHGSWFVRRTPVFRPRCTCRCRRFTLSALHSVTAVNGQSSVEALKDGASLDSSDAVDPPRPSEFVSCLHHLWGQDTNSGSYYIVVGGVQYPVYCDQVTDAGGWTLVASTLGTPVQDQGSSWYNDLTTLQPVSAHTGIWNGFRDMFASSNGDFRVSCKVCAPTPFVPPSCALKSLPRCTCRRPSTPSRTTLTSHSTTPRCTGR